MTGGDRIKARRMRQDFFSFDPTHKLLLGSHETDLVCLEDINDLDYVRQSLDRLPTRNGKPAYHRDGRMVGYALLDSA